MDDKNDFLENYKKKTADMKDFQGQEASSQDSTPSPLHFEEKSDFVEPADFDGQIQPTGKKPLVLVYSLIAIVVIAALIFGLIWYFNRGVEMIDLTDWTISDAELWARNNNVRLQTEPLYNDQYEIDKIFAQNVAAGEMVSRGGFVKVSVSLGHDLTVELSLPDLMTMTKADIDAWVAENFMTKVRITTEFSDTVPSGQVISFTINDNTVVDKVKRSTPIYIIISKGQEDPAALLITVPNFKEKTIAQSIEFANENGIILTVNEAYDDYAPAGSIISQSVKAEEKVARGSEIILVVSKGKKILVPDFSRLSRQQASAVVSQLGIPSTTADKYSSRSTGAFISQSIAAGTIYQTGAILELTYSLGNRIVLSSFVGQTRDAAELWAKGLNEQGAAITIKTTYTLSNSPQGQIIYQNPSNTLISTVATVNITVSLGKIIFMPQFVAPEGSGYELAITREEAMLLCEERRIIPIFVAENNSARLPGEVWYQSIAAGQEVTENTTVTLKYNPANVTIAVPNFVGMTQAEIIAAGHHKKMTITFAVGDTYVDGFAGKVYEQSLPPSGLVSAGTAITLTISPPAPTPDPKPTPEPAPTPEPTPTPTPEP